jgi:sialate O-acetylesterase
MRMQLIMNRRCVGRLAVLLSSVCLGLASAAMGDETAAMSLGQPFSDNMVLQRTMPVPVWGWAASGDNVTVTFAGQSKNATAGKDGAWKLTLDPLTASFEPRVLSVRSAQASDALTLTNVVVGDVWICAGQSNMEMGLNRMNGANPKVVPVWTSPETVTRANQPGLRLFCAPKQFVTEPADRYFQNGRTGSLGQWKPCTIENATRTGIWYGFSAVGFYFGLAIQSQAGVPVGLMQVAHGGTAAEAWMSPAAVKSLTHKPYCPSTADVLAANPKAREVMKSRDLNSTSACYNGLLHPLLPMAVRGVIWYQGEHNANGDWNYAETLESLIADWRAGFGQPDLPFYIVQLCSLKMYFGNPTTWPAIREAQLQVHQHVKNTGLVVTTDLYNWNAPSDIHPNKKQEVGHRLALWALRDCYGKTDIKPSGPIYREMKIEDDKVRLFFDHADGGLICPSGHPNNQSLPGFTVAGEDRYFRHADAVADGETVVVSARGVSEPRFVRYGWDIFIPFSFYNLNGLPATPFRTDDWKPGVLFDTNAPK